MLVAAVWRGAPVPAGDDQRLLPAASGGDRVSPTAVHDADIPAGVCERDPPTEVHEGLPDAGMHHHHLLTAVRHQMPPAAAERAQVPPWAGNKGALLLAAMRDQVLAAAGGNQAQELIDTSPKQVQVPLPTGHPPRDTPSHNGSEALEPHQEEPLCFKMSVVKEMKTQL